MLNRFELKTEPQSISWQGLFILIMLIIANVRAALEQLDHDELSMGEDIITGDFPVTMFMHQFNRIYRVGLIDETQPLKAEEINLTIDEMNFIREALLQSCSEQVLLSLIPEDNFNIVVAPEKHLQSLFNTNEPIYGANSAELKGIFVNEFVLDNINDPERKQQLVAILNNEVSHAISRQTKQMKLKKNNQSPSGLFKIAPWTSDTEFKKIDHAYKLYQQRIEEYRNISEKSKLSIEEQKKLQQYNRAIETYTIFLYGKHKKTVFDALPSKKAKTLKKTNRNYFFQEYDHRTSVLTNELYSKDKHTNLVERISDFDMLPEKIKRTFGKELCDALDELHELPPDSYCSRMV